MRLLMSDRPLNIAFKNGTENNFIDLSKLKIATCIGCFSCWIKTPSKCVIRDDATTVSPIIAQSAEVVYVSKVKYGMYDSIMKTMFERALPMKQAFLHVYNGEIHHVPRNVVPKNATVVAYGDISEAEKTLFRRFVSRNAYNMLFENFNVIFTQEENLEKIVSQEVSSWES